MSGRPIISYEDITLPYDQPEGPSDNAPSSSRPAHAPPPSKKRKRNQKGKRRENPHLSSEPQKHLSNNANHYSVKVGTSQQQKYDAEGEVEVGVDGEGEYEYEEEEESRELTHEEIWDDSALLDAWESAMEEYKAFHGPEEDWKKEPLKKSPLWYNVPIEPSKKQAKIASVAETIGAISSAGMAAKNDDTEADSKPLDFDTFVPTHDPSLDFPPIPAARLPATTPTTKGSDAIPGSTTYIPDFSGHMVSQDEAFHRAMSAMYWSGYWTAMYHSQRQLSQIQVAKVEPSTVAMHEESGTTPEEEQGAIDDQEEYLYEGEIELEGEEEEEDEFVSTQR